MTLTLDIPVGTQGAQERQKRVKAAVAMYDAQLVSQGQAAELAGLSRAEFIDALGRFGVSPFQYSAEEALAEARCQ